MATVYHKLLRGITTLCLLAFPLWCIILAFTTKGGWSKRFEIILTIPLAAMYAGLCLFHLWTHKPTWRNILGQLLLIGTGVGYCLIGAKDMLPFQARLNIGILVIFTAGIGATLLLWRPSAD